jgi:hypothetical protein
MKVNCDTNTKHACTYQLFCFRRAEVLFPFKGKYTPPVDEPAAKKPRTDSQTSPAELTSTGKLAPYSRFLSLIVHKIQGPTSARK